MHFHYFRKITLNIDRAKGLLLERPNNNFLIFLLFAFVFFKNIFNIFVID